MRYRDILIEEASLIARGLAVLPGGRRLLASAFWQRVAGGAVLVLAGTLAGRIAGFVREAALAYRLGASETTDVAIVALTYADLMTSLLIAGGMSAVLIPQLSALAAAREGDDSAERDLFWRALLAAVLAATGIALTASLASGSLVRLLAPGLSADASTHAARLMAVSAWAFPGWAVAGVSTAFLQHRGAFGIPALQNVAFNAVAVFTLLFFVSVAVVWPLAVAAVVGAALIALMQLARVVTLIGRPRLAGWRLPDRFVRRYAQALATGAGLVALPFLVRALASLQGPGGLSVVNFATKLIELPNGTLLTALSVALFPALTAAFAEGERARSAALVRRAALLLFGVSVVAALLVTVPAPLWAQIIYGRGQLTADDVASVGGYARILGLGLPGQALAHFMISVAAMQRDYFGPLVIVVAQFAVFALALGQPLSAGMGGLSGLASAQAAFYWVLAALLAVYLAKRHGIVLAGRSAAPDR